MKKLLIIPIMLLLACDDQPKRPSNNLEVVINEYPKATIYSEKPNTHLQDWIIVKDNQIYSVHVSNMTVEYTYLLSIRYDPNNIIAKPIDTQIVPYVDTSIKIGTSVKH